MVLDTSNGKKPEHGKITNYVRNYGEQPQTANKNSVIIVGNLLTQHDNGRGISRFHRVQVGPNPGYTIKKYQYHNQHHKDIYETG